MKYVCNFIAALAALLMVSCATSKKMAKDTEQVRVDSVAEKVAHVEDVAKMVDTTRNEREQIIITEITFFSPDTTAGTPPPEITIDGTGKVTGGGNIKAIKQTTISKVKEEKGESKETAKTETNKDNATIHKQQEQTHVAKESKNPVMWSWVIAASIIAVLVLLLRFRTPIFTWLRNILTALRKILD